MHLTHLQITEAFPEEIKSEVPRLLKLYRRRMNEVQAYITELYSNSKYDETTKQFFKQVCYEWVGLGLEGKIKRLKRYSFQLRKKLQPEERGQQELDVEGAKQIPLESLHDFGKMKHGSKRIHTSCPFHDEKKPSFVIYKDTNSYCCFSCQAAGDNIDFVMKLNGCEFVDAVKFILKD